MKIDILTLFPSFFETLANESIIKNAIIKKKITLNIYNLRDWSKDRHHKVDDTPYGGGAGMILKPDIVDSALVDLRKKDSIVLLMGTKGKIYNQSYANKLSRLKHLIIICGHYSEYDERIRSLIDEEISIGEFVLTGGEIPAMAIIDSITRIIPGVINEESIKDETYSKKGYKQYPFYTRPYRFTPKSIKSKDLLVPEVLINGNHKDIGEWRDKNSVK